MVKSGLLVLIVACLVGAGSCVARALRPTIGVRCDRWERYDSGWINTYTQARAIELFNTSDHDIRAIEGTIEYARQTVPFRADPRVTLRAHERRWVAIESREVCGRQDAKIAVTRFDSDGVGRFLQLRNLNTGWVRAVDTTNHDLRDMLLVAGVLVVGPELLEGLAAEEGVAALELGEAGEAQLAAEVGGESQVAFETSLGRRVVDQFADGVAYESKMGYVTLTDETAAQIAKDGELLSTGQVRAYEWWFRTSPAPEVASALAENGIVYRLIR